MAPTWLSRSEGMVRSPRPSRRRHPFLFRPLPQAWPDRQSDPVTEDTTKNALRAELTRRRARAFAVNPMAGQTLAALFPAALAPKGGIVSAYAPFRDEIDPMPLATRLARLGCRIALPVTPPKGSPEPLTFRLWTPGQALVRSAYGVMEPDPDLEVVHPDLVLAPLLGFDRRGHRLGWGAGHYDKALSALRALKPVTAVGLAFAAQEVDRVPEEPFDEVLDGIATETAYIPVRNA